jgi:Putative DNA-binding domain
MSALVDKALKAKRESKLVDFKSAFDPESTGDWCELVKDVVAMANSGGGAIVIGLDNGGSPSKNNVKPVLDLDHAKFVDKIRKYTGFEFGELEVHEAKKQDDTVAVIEISAVKVPMVFTEVGTYAIEVEGKQKQKTAFSKGTVYFRHGAKSEPGTTEDIRNVIERQLEAIRGEWLDGVRKVVRAPQGSSVTVFSGEVKESNSPEATPIRLVDDPNAPGYRLIDHDTTYPHRQTELVDVVNGMLPEGIDVNTYDILAVRRVHGIDGDPRYCHTPKFGSPQYSDNFAKWIVDRHKENKNFFAEARQKYYDQTHSDS